VNSREPISILGSHETVDAMQRQATNKGITLGGIREWTVIRNIVKEADGIAFKEEFLIHLRILADHYLPMKLGEINRVGWHSAIKATADAKEDAKKQVRGLERALVLKSVARDPDLNQLLISPQLRERLSAVLNEVRQELDNEHLHIVVPEKGFSRSITDHSKHALVNTFEALWKLYSECPRKGKNELASLFFAFAGYRATGTKASTNDRNEKQAVRDLFRDAREKGAHLGPLTTVRRLTPEEMGALKTHFSKSKPTF
jgi:hypothetical protein